MWKRTILVTLTVISLSILLPFPPAMAQETTLSVEPAGTFGLQPGDVFSTNINVWNVTDLYAWQFILFYRSSVLNATTRLDSGNYVPAIDEGPFLKTGGVSTFFVISNFTDNYNATHGFMWVSCTRVGPGVGGVDGNGTLATVTFKAVGSGSSILHLSDTDLLDSAEPFGLQIPHTPIDGQAYVGLVDVAVNQIDTPASIPRGSMAPINVTAQNRGIFVETFDVTLTYNSTPIGTQTALNLPGGESQILPFVWDVTLVPIGQYNLTATATTVPGETDTSDNTLSLLVNVGLADLAITDLTILKTVIGQGFSTPINVTVVNQGDSSETSNITVYANQTVIATLQNINMTSGNSTTFTFTWDTTIFAKGNYTISAYVQPVPYETDTANNNVTRPGMVMVGMPGDVVSPYGVIDMKDIAYVAKRFGTDPSKPLWDPNADIDGSGKVDMKDIAKVAKGFGQHDP
jgi:hypothetical protein